MGKNLLAEEKSPYLAQHKDNPVWWHPWSDAAFDRARREDKPVFLSIGYSTCYWCHVMEKDSFEHQSVADILNEHYVSIKVDREELPDIDQMYMQVVLGIHGHGGWPMSVFLTPDRKPFWGGTFFYRDVFCKILGALHDAWCHERDRVLTSSEELTRFLRDKQATPVGGVVDGPLLERAIEQLLGRYDARHGGFGSAPKFPPTQQLRLLSRLNVTTGGAATREAIATTLTSMARGGLFDHVGGGFHRYSVDERWLIPHFEKMLYDNALLVSTYLDGYVETKQELYRDVAARTLDYLLRDMRSPEGGFYCAEDAGEVNREGEFYVWSATTIRGLLPEEVSESFMRRYGVTDEGNFEGGASVLHIPTGVTWAEATSGQMIEAREVLFRERARRPRPALDTKMITAWNGLTITALCRGYQILGDERYRQAALQCARCIRAKLHSGATLLRRYRAGDSRFAATLEDYAYLTEGILQLYYTSGDAEWLRYAMAIQDEQHERLWSPSVRAYVASRSLSNIVDIREWEDGATPSPNGVSLDNLLALGAVTGEQRFSERAEALEGGIPTEITAHPSAYSRTLAAVVSRLTGSQVCVVSPSSLEGPLPPPELRDLWRRFLPLTTLLWRAPGSEPLGIVSDKGPVEGQSAFYVCENKTCRNPVVDVDGAVEVCLQASKVRGISA